MQRNCCVPCGGPLRVILGNVTDGSKGTHATEWDMLLFVRHNAVPKVKYNTPPLPCGQVYIHDNHFYSHTFLPPTPPHTRYPSPRPPGVKSQVERKGRGKRWERLAVPWIVLGTNICDSSPDCRQTPEVITTL